MSAVRKLIAEEERPRKVEDEGRISDVVRKDNLLNKTLRYIAA